MPATDIHQSSSFISILSRRRDQVHSMEPFQESNSELGSFQRQVADRFQELSSSDSELLSIDWIRQLLDVFLCCQEEFKAIVFNNKTALNKAPMDRYVSEYFERSVKALDLCNAIRDGIELIRQWQNQLEIVLCALENQRCVGEGQVKRARKALVDLAIGMLDEKQSALAQRNRSFGRHNKEKESSKFGHFRSLSWSVSRTWSASKQLQAISNNLIAPKGNEIVSTNGLNVAVFTMHYVLFFVTWALVAAIPCQDRGLQTQFSAPKQFLWSDSILSLHDRIFDESKKKDRKNSCGLLKEIHDIEKCARHMNELTDVIHFPLSDENEVELKQRVYEIRLLYEGLKSGLNPLEKQVREVFHRIVRSRTEGLDSVGK